MVQHPQDLFPFRPGGQGVVQTGHGVQQDQGRPEEGGSGHGQGSPGPHQHQHQRSDRQQGADPVGNGVPQLFSQRVGRDAQLSLFFLFHEDPPMIE